MLSALILEEIYVQPCITLLPFRLVYRQCGKRERDYHALHRRHPEKCEALRRAECLDDNSREVNRLSITRIDSITQSSQTSSDRIPDKEEIGRWSVQNSPLISKQIEICAIGLKACDIDVQA